MHGFSGRLLGHAGTWTIFRKTGKPEGHWERLASGVMCGWRCDINDQISEVSMQTEEKLIPFHPTNLTGKRVLALAPHPDDETIGCGGSLAIHANAGDPVKVVFLTNGARGDTSGKAEKKSYIKIRQEEARKACKCLGITDLEFWAYEDRALAGSRGVLTRMIDLLEGYKPDLVYAPSLLEFHPDHRATAVLLCDAICTRDLKFEVAFYEVGQPLSVNCLVDITSVLNQKMLAGNAYSSQLRERPYKDIFLGLNRFRSLTLSDEVTHAEGFSLWGTDIVRKIGAFSIPFQGFGRFGPAPGEAGPLVSVIVRTKDRPVLFANALRSIVRQTYANLEIVVVNDGGQDVKDIVRALAGVTPVVYVHHEKSRGRSAAANAGLDHAQGMYLIFLDDDDWFESNHISSLVAALEKEPQAKVAYTGVRGIFNANDDKPLFFNQRFDPVGLIGGNYIPIHAALFHRSLLRSGCRFDENLEVYEDWDFWLQLSKFTRFIHLDQISANYRASDNSGVGLWADESKTRHGREAIYEKWGKIWSGKEINALLTQTERVRKALAEEVDNSKKLLSVQAEEIRARDDVIKGQAEEIRAKDTHIYNLEYKLDLIKGSRVWRLAEFFQKVFYR